MTAKGRRGVGARHRDTWSFGSAPPRGGDRRFWPQSRRSQIRRRRRIPAVTAALAMGYAAAGAYGVTAVHSFVHVGVTVDGLGANAVLTSATLAQRSIRFAVKPSKQIGRSSLALDGVAVAESGFQILQTSVLWRPGTIAEGSHEIVLSVPRPGMGDARFHRRFVIDDSAPAIGVPPLLEPAGVCQAVTVQGHVERSASLTLDGAPLAQNKGTFTLSYDRPPAAPLHLSATDPAGNSTQLEVVAPVVYPGGQGVHVTAAAWGYEPLRRGILALIDAKLVSSVELDLKDEGGIWGGTPTTPRPPRSGRSVRNSR